jgi:hypothetical protein
VNGPSAVCQDNLTLVACEDSLMNFYKSVIEEGPIHKEKTSLLFYEKFCDILEKEGSFSYPFSRLKNIGKVSSSDSRLRIYTWNIPFGADDNLYFGIIQFYSATSNKHILIKLNEPIKHNKNSKPVNWHGALYYEIIVTKHAGQKYYTLLGFDLYNSLSNKKRIDIISIDDFDKLYFCKKLIRYNDTLVDFLEFQYNEKVVMSLRYNKDIKMIVFDHLSPNKPSMQDNYEFYGPDFTYDGLKFEKGIWIHHKNIDITN